MNQFLLLKNKTVLSLLLVLLFSGAVNAQTNIWDGSSSNNWNTATNWSLNLVPTAAHDVVINTNSAILVDANATVNSLTISGSAVVFFKSSGTGRTITVDNTGSSIGSGSTLTLQGSTGAGTRSMSIVYTGTNRTMSVAGTLILTSVGDGTIYNATNSITTVTGTIINNDSAGGTAGVITSAATNLIFASGGTYKHELDGGAIPTATWSATSNCNITGFKNNDPANLTGQIFGNLTWNCAGQTANMASPSAGLTIAGNLIIQNSSIFQFRFGQPGNNTIGGDFIMSGGNARISSGTLRTVDVAGNVFITAGTLDMSSGSQIGTLNVTGDFTHTGGTITESSTGLGSIFFNKAGIQTYTSGGTVTNTINFTVNSGSTLQMAAPTTVVTGNSFVLSTGATLGITSTVGITTAGTAAGNIQTATRTFSTAASYTYNGSSVQAAGTGLPATVSNLTISNATGVTLGQATVVTNNFSITSGAIANLGAFTHTTGSLAFGGIAQVPESWGSTSSSADNKNDTYFAATAGIVNNSCIPPAITSQPTAITICENTGGTFAVATSTGSPTYQWQYSGDNITWTNIDAALNPYVSGYTTATFTLSNAPAGWNGNYVRCIVRSGSGCRTNSTSVLLTVNSSATPATKTWNGSAWSPAGAPTANQNITFAGNYAVATDITACSCTITSGTVTIVAGKNLILGSKLTVSGGSLTFENNASLVQTTYTGANSGNITYRRNTTTNSEFDYTYWSSPVAAQNLLAISPLTKLDKFFSFDAAANNWVQENPSTTTMTVGKGYIVRGVPPPVPVVPPGLFPTTSFIGEPNNGTKTIAIVGGATSNLIGNPYPSALYADTFLSANSSAIDGTIYFWTHNTAIQDRNNILSTAGSGAYAYTSNDYASYNTTGGVIAVSGGVQPTGKIAAGQSFFTTSTVAGGTVTFTNAMRVDLGIPLDNSNFYRTTTNTKKANTIEKNRAWLNLTNTQGAFKQTLVGYITNATNDYDGLFDGESLDGNKFVDFYSVNQGKNLTIQGRSLPFNDTDEVPLGLKTTIAGNFTINIDRVDGLLTNQSVFIEDKLTNTVFDLKKGNYTFTTVAGTFNERFVLRYNNNKTLGVDEKDKEDGILVFYSNNYKTLIIHNNVVDSIVNTVTLFNITGQNILNWDVKDGEQTNIQIPIKNISSGIYIVKVKTMKGESSKKIIVN